MNNFLTITARNIVSAYMYANDYDYELWQVSEIASDAIMDDPSWMTNDVTLANLVNAVKTAFREEVNRTVGIGDDLTEIPESRYLGCENTLIKLVESKFSWL